MNNKEPNKNKTNPFLFGIGIGISAFIINSLFFKRNPSKSISGPVRKAGWLRNFYEGGFKDQMDRSEAALILGCRRSSPQKVVLKKYRILINANHPDKGGAPYLARKINEAKAIMMRTSD